MSEKRPLRFGGITWWGRSNEPSPTRDRFMALAAEADEHGVQWRDLLQDGYRAPGDLVMGGIAVHFDWRWRTEELQRRLDLDAEA